MVDMNNIPITLKVLVFRLAIWHYLKLFRLRELPGGGFTEVARFLWQKHRYPHHGQIPKYVGKLTIFGGEFTHPLSYPLKSSIKLLCL